MKKRNIVIGIALVFVAALILLDAFGLFSPLGAFIGEISLLSLILGVLLLCFSVICILKLSFPPVVIFLALIFMLFEKNIAFLCGYEDENILNNWLLFAAAVILAIGLKFILPKRRKEHSTNLGESTIYLDSKKKYHNVRNRFSECKIYFENKESYAGGSTLNVSNKFGETTVLVPREWKVDSKVKSSFGEYNLPKCDAPEDAPILKIEGSNSFGELNVIYI